MKSTVKIHGSGRWLVAVLLVAIALVVAATALMAADPDIETRERLRAVGSTRASIGAPKAVAKVGQQMITSADVAEAKAQVAANLAYMRDEIAEGDILASDLQARVTLIEESGVDNVALAGLIADAALYEKALDSGVDATDDEVKTAVARQREIEDRPGFTKSEGYIKAVGEDRYWSELMPAWQRRSIVKGKMYASVTAGVDAKDAARHWAEWNRETIRTADIEVVDSSAIAPATVDDALRYLEKYWRLN